MRWPGRVVWPAAALLAVGSELVALPGTSRGDAAADLASGAVILFAGLVGWRLRSDSLIGPLVVAAGIAWFGGTLVTADIGVLAAIGALTVTLHRGPLVHAVLADASGRVSGRVDRSVVVAAYFCAALTPLGESRAATAAVAVLVLAAAGLRLARTGIAGRRRGRANLAAAALLALALAVVVAPGAAESVALGKPLVVYEFLLAGLSVGLVVPLVGRPSSAGAVADLVVELGGGSGAGTLRGRLARALGDPSLEVGYRLEESSSYVDELGRPLVLPVPGSRRQVTPVERDGRRLAVLIHDSSVLADPVFVEGVAAAVAIAVSNVRLQAEIWGQLEEIEVSRRRIVAAADVERRRLEQQFRLGPERRLADVERRLRRARAEASAARDDELAAVLDDAHAELSSAGEELRSLANGIHPALLTEDGLAAALPSLVSHGVVPVQLECLSERLPPSIEGAAYFVCSEALANLGKYAGASHARVTVSRVHGRLVVSVQDDGVGGADPRAGSGLRGLADRVEALGGTLRVESPTGRGTLLVADLPLPGDRPSARR